LKHPITTVLFHYGTFQPLWQQASLLQAGPHIFDGPESLHLNEPSVPKLLKVLARRRWDGRGVLLHYSDPFLMRSAPLRDLQAWPGPTLLACGDLHHGPSPIETLEGYLRKEPHDAVLLTFNPSWVDCVQKGLNVPVRCLAPTFFRYPTATPISQRRMELLHVGSLGPHHPHRRALVEALLARKTVPFRHARTHSAEEAATLYADHALVLNVPLNNDLNHRFFEVMAAGVPQVIVGDRSLMGDLHQLADRPDVFWSNSLDELEALVQHLFANPEALLRIPVAPPTDWPLKRLLKKALAP
jgi:hypothetical protein